MRKVTFTNSMLSKSWVHYNEFSFIMATTRVTAQNTCILKGPFTKQEEINTRNYTCSHHRKQRKWDVFGALLVNMEATMPSPWALWCGLASGPRQKGIAVCGQPASSASSHFLLRLNSRQKLALWGSCRSANPQHSRDTEEDAGQILHEKPSPHSLLSLGGCTEGSPLSDFMLLCSSQGKVRESKEKQL